MVTHSLWRGDFCRLARAQSCAEATCATQRINKESKAIRFMVWLSQRGLWPEPYSNTLGQKIVVRYLKETGRPSRQRNSVTQSALNADSIRSVAPPSDRRRWRGAREC